MCSLASLCKAATFSQPQIFGTQPVSLTASLVTGFSLSVPAAARITQPPREVRNATFCNVTLSYTHPGTDDLVTTETWLPTANYNGVLETAGGSGFTAGRTIYTHYAMAGAMSEGYATTTTDAGAPDGGYEQEPILDWALLSEGNVDMNVMRNFGTTSLNENAIIAKALAKQFYGDEPRYSYFNGCSQGGRQALTLAQRYPEAYDGIMVGAPGINWSKFITSLYWPQQVMNMMGEYPHYCELAAIAEAAVEACDGLDGVTDGIVTRIDECAASFDPYAVVGREIDCVDVDGPKGMLEVSRAAADVVSATYQGPVDRHGNKIYWGLPPGAELLAANTNCTSGTCVSSPVPSIVIWFKYFLLRDDSREEFNFTHKEFDLLMRDSYFNWFSTFETSDSDLSAFQEAGGKMLMMHGLADILIPPQGSAQYWDAVDETVPNTADFFRHFEIPGLGHCSEGKSRLPESLFGQLRAWVENGTAPDKTPVIITDLDGELQERIVCAYPKMQSYDEGCGDTGSRECWSCV